MDLAQLSKQLDASEAVRASWQPQSCGEIDICIDVNGDWYHQGTLITRIALVRLFAGVLRYEDEHYYLVTPAEKMQIQVADVPFYIHQLQLDENQFTATTTLGLQFTGPVAAISFDGEQLGFTLWQNTQAKLTRAEHLRVSQTAEVEGNQVVFQFEQSSLKFTLN